MNHKGLVLLGAAAITIGAHCPAQQTYAITGARVVTVTGAPIPSGTVLIRRGLIESAGAAVRPPSDAAVIDGKGLTVYPGLIDMGKTALVEHNDIQPPQNPKSDAEVDRWKRAQLLRASFRARDSYKLDAAEIKKLTNAGVTAVLLVPPGEGITGESALVHVAPPDEPRIGEVSKPGPGPAVLQPAVAMHMNFPNGPRGRGFPESL